MTDPTTGARPHTGLTVLAAALDVVLFSDIVFRSPAVRGPSTPAVAIVLFAAIGMLVLHRRHRRPTGVVVALCVHSAAAALWSSYRPVIMVVVALAGAAHRRGGRALAPAVAGALACQVTWVVAELRTTPGPATTSVAFGVWLSYLVILLVALGAGRWRRAVDTRTHAARRHHDELFDAERRRIGRELHDTVAHALTLMVLHADAATRALARDPGRARSGLDAVATTGRDAVGELRRVLTGLRGAHGTPGDPAVPSPVTPIGRPRDDGDADLDGLVRTVRGLGRRVELTRTGDGPVDPVDPHLERDAFRVVQESVTNALKHGRADTWIDVRVIRGRHRLSVEVVDRAPADHGGGGHQSDSHGDGGHGHETGQGDGCHGDGGHGHETGQGDGGHGLVGMAERVRERDGSFSAGPLGDGGFRVRATWTTADAPAPAVTPRPARDRPAGEAP